MRQSRIVIALAMTGVVSSDGAGQATTPGARRLASMVYDAAHREMILFGGIAPESIGDSESPNDLWAWNGRAWRRIDAGGKAAPAGRAAAHMVYDVGRGRVVLFGGRQRGNDPRNPDILGDLWEWDGQHWTSMESAGTPALLHAATAYDPVHKRVLMFGGLDARGFSRSLRAYDGKGWTMLDSLGPRNIVPAMGAVDANGDFLLVTNTPSGDRDPTPDSSVTWVWGSGTWARAEYAPPLANLQPTASAPNGEIYFYQVQERWLTAPLMHVRSSTGKWTTLTSPPGPGYYGAASAYDTDRKRFVLFGVARTSTQHDGETWEFDGRDWVKR